MVKKEEIRKSNHKNLKVQKKNNFPSSRGRMLFSLKREKSSFPLKVFIPSEGRCKSEKKNNFPLKVKTFGREGFYSFRCTSFWSEKRFLYLRTTFPLNVFVPLPLEGRSWSCQIYTFPLKSFPLKGTWKFHVHFSKLKKFSLTRAFIFNIYIYLVGF